MPHFLDHDIAEQAEQASVVFGDPAITEYSEYDEVCDAIEDARHATLKNA